MRITIVHEKNVMFVLFCLFVCQVLNNGVCENGNTIKQCNFRNNYRIRTGEGFQLNGEIWHVGVDLPFEGSCKNFYCPMDMLLRGKFINKIPNFDGLTVIDPHPALIKLKLDGIKSFLHRKRATLLDKSDFPRICIRQKRILTIR